ncbi:MAG: phage head closure protein [Pseudomonadota bacterium]
MKRPTLAALRHRVTIEQPIRTDDEGGAATLTWQQVATVWAEITGLDGREILRAETLVGRATHRIVMRYRTGIDASMRIVSAGKYHEIISALDEEGRNQWLVCYCEEFGP